MQFWEDLSPLGKGAIVIGIVGILYFFVIAPLAGLPPSTGSCTHTVGTGEDAQEVSGCPEGVRCVDGVCVGEGRGL
jgi:hypothetical protein